VRTWPVVALFLLVVLLPRSAAAAVETVSYKVGRDTVRAYLASPPRTSNVPGVVVIHEMWGLNDQIMGVADRMSRLGYVVIAPDLFGGKLGADPGLAQELMQALDENRAVAIVKGAIDYLRKLDDAPRRPVGTVGFGMGGRVSLATALQGADVQATVIFYGRVETTREGVAPLKAPVLGFFGVRDAVVLKQDVEKFQTALKESGKDARIILNEGLGHGFMNEDRADYEAEFSKDSWIRMREWLAEKLQGAPPKPPRTLSDFADEPPASPGTAAAPTPAPSGP